MSYKSSILITGGTAGLGGYHAALEIAKKRPQSLIVLSSRTDKNNAADTINKALGQSNAIFIPLDLGNLTKVRAYAEDWATKNYPPIEALLLNAGLQFPGPLTLTVDGLEATFGINHAGHALLFHLLAPHFRKTPEDDGRPPARIIVTSSGTHDPAQGSGLPDAAFTTAEELARPTAAATAGNAGRQRYGSSKLANIMWTYALDRKLKERQQQQQQQQQQNQNQKMNVAVTVTVNAFDPGLMPGTGLAREAGALERFAWNCVMPAIRPLLRVLYTPNVHTPAESGAALARLAVADDVVGVSGRYYEGLKPIESSRDSHDQAKQEDLWRWTVEFLARDEEERRRFEEFR